MPKKIHSNNNEKILIIIISVILIIAAVSISGHFLIQHLTKQPTNSKTTAIEPTGTNSGQNDAGKNNAGKTRQPIQTQPNLPTTPQSAQTLSAKTYDDLVNTKESEVYQLQLNAINSFSLISKKKLAIENEISNINLPVKNAISRLNSQNQSLNDLIQKGEDEKLRLRTIARDEETNKNKEMLKLNDEKDLIEGYIKTAEIAGNTERKEQLQKDLEKNAFSIRVNKIEIGIIKEDLPKDIEKITKEQTDNQAKITTNNLQLVDLKEKKRQIDEIEASLEAIIIPKNVDEVENPDDPQYWTKNRFGHSRRNITYYEEETKKINQYQAKLPPIETQLNNIESSIKKISTPDEDKKTP